MHIHADMHDYQFVYVNTVKFLEQVFGTLHFFDRYLHIYERLMNYY